ELNLLLSKGFARVLLNGEVKFIEDILNPESDGKKKKATKISGETEILIDRTSVNPGDDDTTFRLGDSIQTAFFEVEGDCYVYSEIPASGTSNRAAYSDRFELDGMTFTEPSVNFFSFNNPYGACQTCEGFGKVLGIDED